jgi:hypothetical protein
LVKVKEDEKKEEPPAEEKPVEEEPKEEAKEEPEEEEKPAEDDKKDKSGKPHVKNHWVDDGDIFESSFGKDRHDDNDFSTVGYEESSDYDREMMGMDEVRFDDESWPYF